MNPLDIFGGFGGLGFGLGWPDKTGGYSPQDRYGRKVGNPERRAKAKRERAARKAMRRKNRKGA